MADGVYQGESECLEHEMYVFMKRRSVSARALRDRNSLVKLDIVSRLWGESER